jgi:hypothetical protein
MRDTPLTEEALDEALRVVLTAPAHAVTVITTTRVKPTTLLMVEPAAQRQLQMDEGLGSPDAETSSETSTTMATSVSATRLMHYWTDWSLHPRLPARVGGDQGNLGW